eukprot:CAMPEP_0197189358 /NCGR_PEP_ID=MMETSP1423-20130617/19620_1 /TAXON_ID=476441 /ORGANISM="Pseudo-nitzschia heimii, Strain UNC1101" /LENGTH=526 /DNA_ID=CAMNT_0042641445 /DNA_START=255 /DNA_END=1832 /DNA_ORIENTATION=+
MTSETAAVELTGAYFELELKIDKCKFYPLKPLAIIAGNVITMPKNVSTGAINCDSLTENIQGSIDIPNNKSHVNRLVEDPDLRHVQDQLKVGVRCLVYVSESSGQVPSLIERWAKECNEKKQCTNWIEIAQHMVTFRIDVNANSTKSTLEECRSVPGAWMLRSSRGMTRICDPPTLHITMMMDQSKFYPTKLAILDGVIRSIDRNSKSELISKANEKLLDSLESGERCWLHVRSNVLSLMKTLQGDNSEKFENDTKRDKKQNMKRKKVSTGWVQFARPILVSCRVIINDDLLGRKPNVKGAFILECYQIINIRRNSECDISGNVRINSSYDLHPPQTRADRKERHRIFAEWLVKIYGANFLSTGSGVLDVAGGNGALGHELWKLGVKSTLLDPDPRCDPKTVPFKVISEPLIGDGSDLTEERQYVDTTHPNKSEQKQQVRQIVRSCSIMAGMHPDEATEAVIDTSLRLGKPFAILPCCVFRNLNPERKEKRKQKREAAGGTDPFRSYSTFCRYLLKDKAPAGIFFK